MCHGLVCVSCRVCINLEVGGGERACDGGCDSRCDGISMKFDGISMEIR